MPRDIPVGNGTLLVCFDRDYTIRDLYFPHVGQENHMGGGLSRCGVWAPSSSAICPFKKSSLKGAKWTVIAWR